MTKRKLTYEHTIYACYIGYITQAIVNNYAPLLFLTFQRDMGLTLPQITVIPTLTFFVQLMVDLISTKVVDRIGYRTAALMAHACAAAGLICMAVLPVVLPSAYVGLLISICLYAIGGGLNEVIVSPIVESCPTEKKEAAMGLLHSFYSWGQTLVVLVSTIFFVIFGISHWRLMAVLWSLIPLANFFFFMKVPLYPIVAEGEPMPLGRLLKNHLFWLMLVIMICTGASELAMSQWASTFAESALHVSKTVGDLAGMMSFAILMGISRVIYGKFSDKVPLVNMMIGSAVLCVVCYLAASLSPNPVIALLGCAVCGFSVGIFWPGTFSLAAVYLPSGGTAMYALMALAGDIGCSAGPTVTGLVASAAGGKLTTGLLAAMAFPVVLGCALVVLRRKKR